MTLSTPSALIDIGLNLTHDSFDHDRAAVIERAVKAGVTRMVLTGSSIGSTRAAIALVKSHPTRFRCTAGIHPHHAGDLDAGVLEELTALVDAVEVAAVGECGLDFFRDLSPRDVQRTAFADQLRLAARVRKPVFLHQRDAHEDFVAILREHRSQLVDGVAHCFTGTTEQATAYLDLDLYIGITGWICDERRGLHLREVVRHVPIDRLLIETDAPYLLPRDLRPAPSSRRNEPMYLPHILDAIAQARGEPATQLAMSTTENAQRLFRWAA